MHSPVLDVVSRPILCTMVKLSDSLVFSDKECQYFGKIRPSFGPFFHYLEDKCPIFIIVTD